MARVNEGEVRGTVDELCRGPRFVNQAALESPGWGENAGGPAPRPGRMSLMPGADSDPNVSTTPMVSVVGTAVLRAEPDEAIVVVTLSALKDGPGPALEDVAHRSEALVALLDEFGIASSERSTTGVSVHEDFDHTSEGRRSLGHRAASAIAVRLADLDLIGRLVTRATTELDARVDGPRWQIAAENPIRLAEAARQAAADGQRKASGLRGRRRRAPRRFDQARRARVRCVPPARRHDHRRFRRIGRPAGRARRAGHHRNDPGHLRPHR